MDGRPIQCADKNKFRVDGAQTEQIASRFFNKITLLLTVYFAVTLNTNTTSMRENNVYVLALYTLYCGGKQSTQIAQSHVSQLEGDWGRILQSRSTGSPNSHFS